jgi:hypothetical protein
VNIDIFIEPLYVGGELQARDSSMSKEELAKFLAAVQQVCESIAASPEAARDSLQKGGYLNEDGSIADHYKSAQSSRGD